MSRIDHYAGCNTLHALSITNNKSSTITMLLLGDDRLLKFKLVIDNWWLMLDDYWCLRIDDCRLLIDVDVD